MATAGLRRHKIGPKQALIIYQVSIERECSLATLARATGTDPAALGRSVDGLLKDGYLERRPHENDRRQSLVSLTKKGMTLLPKIRQVQADLFEELVAALSPEERAVLGSIQSKVLAHLLSKNRTDSTKPSK